MTQERNTPAIRFSGFAEAWKYLPLGELGFATSGVGFPEREQGGSEGTPFFKVSDMNTLGNEDALNIANHYVTEGQVSKNRWKPISDVPALAFAKVGAAVMHNRKRLVAVPFLLDNNMMAYSLGSQWNVDFAQAKFETIDLTTLTQVGALPSIKAPDLEAMEVSIPDSLSEQRRIGSFFSRLNTLITAQRSKVEKLEQLKNAMLDKMFPRAGADAPEVRFPKFTEPWKEKSLDEIADIVGGGTPSTSVADYWDGDIDWYAPAEIGESVYVDRSVQRITEEGLRNSSASMLPAHRTVLFTSRAGIGDMAILRRPGCTNQGFQSLVMKGENDPYFVYSMGHIITDKAIQHASGSTFLEISGKKLGRLRFMVPTPAEQQQIGSFFAHLDSLIRLNSEKLLKLEQVKKALLDRMFV